MLRNQESMSGPPIRLGYFSGLSGSITVQCNSGQFQAAVFTYILVRVCCVKK